MYCTRSTGPRSHLLLGVVRKLRRYNIFSFCPPNFLITLCKTIYIRPRGQGWAECPTALPGPKCLFGFILYDWGLSETLPKYCVIHCYLVFCLGQKLVDEGVLVAIYIYIYIKRGFNESFSLIVAMSNYVKWEDLFILNKQKVKEKEQILHYQPHLFILNKCLFEFS